METKNIKQTVNIKAAPHEVYEALMDSAKHAEFTGGEAKISRKVGGKFTTYDGYAEGNNLELVPDKKIVQTWRASDWPADITSQVTYDLSEIPTGTRLTFTQTGVPLEQYPEIARGWRDWYWAPLKKMLNKT